MTTSRIRIDDLRLSQDPLSEEDIEAQLAAFEAKERARLGLEGDKPREQYVENINSVFTAAQRPETTLLIGGLTMAHDALISKGLSAIGYDVRPLPVPDYESLRYGKEFGNRGQCNPTWFTVGNLVKYLTWLRDQQGMETREIKERFVFLSAGACGPCRFGTYVTEYRKALRDAGFDGFRVVLFQQQGGFKQATGEEEGLQLSPPFFVALIKSLVVGDVINLMGYRLRPYELEPGATNRAVERAKEIAGEQLTRGQSDLAGDLKALLAIRREFSRVRVDRTTPKPKVAIIGEFWAMTTEGDGNYKMQAFLEEEGAEVDIQIVTAWLLFMIWENVRDTKLRMELREDDDKAEGARKGLAGTDPWKKIATLWAAERVLRVVFQAIANTVGVHGYHLPDMDTVAEVAERFYNNELRGGEAHMEVGKVILNTLHSKVNMTLSVKPFGCMPSSGVSDGVQSAITELHPKAIFLPVETSGDGAVNVYSRVQMMLFKAKQQAREETEAALAHWGMTREDVARTLGSYPILQRAWMHPPHKHGATSADTVHLIGRLRNPRRALHAAASSWTRSATSALSRHAREALSRARALAAS